MMRITKASNTPFQSRNVYTPNALQISVMKNIIEHMNTDGTRVLPTGRTILLILLLKVLYSISIIALEFIKSPAFPYSIKYGGAVSFFPLSTQKMWQYPSLIQTTLTVLCILCNV